jgi:hypothetical protein
LYIVRSFETVVGNSLHRNAGQMQPRITVSEASLGDPLATLLSRPSPEFPERRGSQETTSGVSFCDPITFSSTSAHPYLTAPIPRMAGSIPSGSVASDTGSRTSSHSVADHFGPYTTDVHVKGKIQDGFEHDLDFGFLDTRFDMILSTEPAPPPPIPHTHPGMMIPSMAQSNIVFDEGAQQNIPLPIPSSRGQSQILTQAPVTVFGQPTSMSNSPNFHGVF